jgi:hypothetical protein
LQLLNDAGLVVGTTTTGIDGRYKFTSFAETGDYTVKVLYPSGYTSSQSTREVLISRGELTVSGVNFALRTTTTTTVAKAQQASKTAAVDAAIMSLNQSSVTSKFGTLRERMSRARFKTLA